MKRVEVDLRELREAARPPFGLGEAEVRVYLRLYTDIAERRWGKPIPDKPLDQAHCRHLALTAYRVDNLVDDDQYRADLVAATVDLPLERQHRLMKLMHSVGRTLQSYTNMVVATDQVFELLSGPEPDRASGDLDDPVPLDAERRRRRG